MSFQFSIFDAINEQSHEVVDSENTIFVATWNLANPSLERAREQWGWLSSLGANILILSEIKVSQGCDYLQYQLQEAGYSVFNETTSTDNYGVIVAVKGFDCKRMDLGLNYLKSRVVGVEIDTFLGNVGIVGLYVPSRGSKEMRNVEKSNFQKQISDFLQKHTIDRLIIGGDLNVIPRNHVPFYSVFGEWEYSFYDDFRKAKLVDAFIHSTLDKNPDHTWFSKDGNGFRFDFLFVSETILNNLNHSEHIHEPRISKLSDHSVVTLRLDKT
jgi:exodeoxyribonuclease-3